jgi:hypothetical protein
VQVALEMLKELENDGSLPRRNLLRATTLSTACGERYGCCFLSTPHPTGRPRSLSPTQPSYSRIHA